MVLPSELLSLFVLFRTVVAVIFYITYRVIGKVKHHYSVCAESIYSLPITYLAGFVLLEQEPPAAVAAVYFTVIVLNFSYMVKGRWSMKDWVLRRLSVLFTFSISLTYFGFIGLAEVQKNAKILSIDLALKPYHVLGIFFSSWRFFCLSVLLIQAIFQYTGRICVDSCNTNNNNSSRVTAGFKLQNMLACLRIILIWVVLKATRSLAVAPSPWGSIDKILLDGNTLYHITFGIISMLMVFDIISSFVFDEDVELHDWVSFKSESEKWRLKTESIVKEKTGRSKTEQEETRNDGEEFRLDTP